MAEEALANLRDWYDSSVQRLSEVCAERDGLLRALKKLEDEGRVRNAATTTRLVGLQGQLAQVCSVVAAQQDRVAELRCALAAAHEKMWAARREVWSCTRPRWSEILQGLFVLLFGVVLTIIVQR